MSTLVCQLIILFFIFSVVGWMIEVTLKYIQYHRFINRGFMIGPYCPIYGSGVVAITVCVGGLVGVTGSVGDTFLAGFVICGALSTLPVGIWRSCSMPAGGTTASASSI